MSQQVLAHLVGRSQSWVTKIERGEREVERISTIVELAAVLRVDPVELAGLSRPPGPPI
jgi:transcriptional regulator with XRE-family HTH domain